MRPMLDTLELPQVQEIATLEKRVLAEHKPPGMAGSLLQNLGRRPTRVALWGVASGPDALKFTEDLHKQFRDAKPLPFTADIVADAEIDDVVIDDVRIQEIAGHPQRFAYVLTLREFIKPVEPADASDVDAGALDDAKGLVGDLVDGLDLARVFSTGLEQFIPVFTDFVTRLKDINS
jgi:hypothetical protein